MVKVRLSDKELEKPTPYYCGYCGSKSAPEESPYDGWLYCPDCGGM